MDKTSNTVGTIAILLGLFLVSCCYLVAWYVAGVRKRRRYLKRFGKEWKGE